MNTTPIKSYQGLSKEELSQQLMAETDISNVSQIYGQLQSYLKKKDIIRKVELDGVEDLIQGQIIKRITEKGDCFDNKTLLEYFKVIQDTINRIDPVSEATPVANTTIIKDPVTIIQGGLTREEKKQVMDRVRDIIEKAKTQALAENTIINQETTEIVQGDFTEINE